VPDRYIHVACELRGPNLIVARRCRVCGEMARTEFDSLPGRLPEPCRREHGNESVEVPVIVPSLPSPSSDQTKEDR
jgi:hypothetical protein